MQHNRLNKQDIYHIGIVGGGPKGLYALERLCAEIKAQACHRPICIHIFNDNRFFGAGNNYRDDQAAYLLINFNIGYINMWHPDAPAPVVDRPLGLTQWLQEKEKKELDECSFASRAAVGRYLMDGLQQIIEYSPDTVNIKLHEASVSDLHATTDGWQVYAQQKSVKEQVVTFCHQLLLATGHSQRQIDRQDQQYLTHQKVKPPTLFIPYVYPVATQLAPIEAQSIVAIKGMGLTFTDSVLELTEGRGGQFEAVSSGAYHYHPTGKEPKKIYPFSRSGLPMVPRGSTYHLPPRALHFFSEEKLTSLLKSDNTLNWRKDLLPLLQLEVQAAYYECLLRDTKWALPTNINEDTLLKQIAGYHRANPTLPIFDLSVLFDPFPEEKELDHLTVVNYFQHLTVAAIQGEAEHPLAAAAAVWRSVSPIFARFYSFGGLSPTSQKDFLQQYAGQLNRTTYGLPIENAQKLLALARAGILDFSYARGVKVETIAGGSFRFRRANGEKGSEFQALIDARIPKTALTATSLLYANLLNQGTVRLYKNACPDPGEADFEPGCIDLCPEGQVIGEDGNVIANLAVTGIPTEGVTFDNDTLSTHKNNFAPAWAKQLIQQLTTVSSPIKSKKYVTT